MVQTVPPSGICRAHAFRLHPGDNLMASLQTHASVILSRSQHSSAFLLTAFGSVSDITLRLANASRRDPKAPVGSSNNDIRRWSDKRFEIVSLVGTFSMNDGCHIHISLADSEGNTIGGHLIDGVVFTTVEVVMGSADSVEFGREMDDDTGFKEIVIRALGSSSDNWRVVKSVLMGSLIAALGFAIGRRGRSKRA